MREMQRRKQAQSQASAIKACNDQSPGGDQIGPSCNNCARDSTSTPSGRDSDAEGCPEAILHIERPRNPFPILSLVAHNQSRDRARHLVASMDTGADENVLVEDDVKRLGLEIDPTEKPFIRALAGDGEIQALGKVKIHFYLEERGKSYRALFFVLENSALPKTCDVLLSESFVHREKLLEYHTPYGVRAIKVFYFCCDALASFGPAAQDLKQRLRLLFAPSVGRLVQSLLTKTS